MRDHRCPLLLMLIACSCGHRAAAPAPVAVVEAEVRLLPLVGGAADNGEEISGLAWHGDSLVLLPETLGLKPAADGRRLLPGPQRVWVLDRRALVDHLAGRGAAALTPRAVPVTPDLAAWRPGEIDGLEALTFDGDTAWLLAETYENAAGDNPAWLIRGRMSAGGLALDFAGARAIPRPTRDPNCAYEAIFRQGVNVCVIYELNSAAVTPHPAAPCFGADLAPAAALAFPHLAYRVTDATEPDGDGRLWVLNYRYPGSDKSRVEPAAEPLAQRFGVGTSHARFAQVERLVELAITPTGLRLTDRAPIQLALPAPWENGGARNWEGVVRAPGGFLIVTDQHPGPATLLGFVPLGPDDGALQ